MREILFRGKRMDDGEWVEGSFLLDGEAHRPLSKDHLPFSNSYIVPETDLENIDTVFNDGAYYLRTEGYHVIPDSVCQFTGLTDKNGTKIFEGDILLAKVYETAIEDSEVWGKQKIRTGNKIDAVWTVEHKIFNANCGYFIYGKDRRFNRLLTYSVIFNNECEVIGNIHDNPELLGGED